MPKIFFRFSSFFSIFFFFCRFFPLNFPVFLWNASAAVSAGQWILGSKPEHATRSRRYEKVKEFNLYCFSLICWSKRKKLIIATITFIICKGISISSGSVGGDGRQCNTFVVPSLIIFSVTVWLGAAFARLFCATAEQQTRYKRLALRLMI